MCSGSDIFSCPCSSGIYTPDRYDAGPPGEQWRSQAATLKKKTSFGKAVLEQNGYEPVRQTLNKSSGSAHKVKSHHAGQQRHMCSRAAPENISDRHFKCKACMSETHTDVNVSHNIVACHTGNCLARYVAEYVQNTQGVEWLGLEDGARRLPINSQTRTGAGLPIKGSSIRG